ncbi:Ger(x)C family spore germination protein [Aquibacillus saliphilus]|uniref:Ger(x)C family spore germination protein n=1 Tax=Aquibacillus saliphilus TaxID=1909422 RepID=UPI001CF0677A|nr:Ger(x)C family spore germination protein [Aquibacillus saliphilus]
MKKNGSKALLLFMTIFLLTGCWSSRELSDLAVVTALGIDKHEDGYKLTVQVMDPGEIAGKDLTTRTSVTTYSMTGKTVFEALRRLTVTTPRKLYLSHLRIILLGQEFSEGGISQSLDFISRDHEMRLEFSLMITKNMEAEKALKILTPIEKIPANKIYSSLQTAQDNWAPAKIVELDELVSSLTVPGKEAVLTGLSAVGSPEVGAQIENVEVVDSHTIVNIDEIGVFKDDKLVGWFNENESKGFNYITDNVRNTIGWVECGKEEEGTISVEVTKNETKLKGSIDSNLPKITIETTIEANIADVECAIDVYDQSKIKEIEGKLKKKIEEIIKESIGKAKELNSDVFGFGQVLSRQEPKQWKQLKDNWDKEFADLDIEVKVKFNIRGTGTITETLLGNMK